MASGMGVKGTQGRCYGFFADLKECQETVKEDLKESKEDNAVKRQLIGGICNPHRIDYFECLHSFKENKRIKAVVDEIKRQEHEAKHGSSNQH